MKWGNSERFLSLRGSFDAYFSEDNNVVRLAIRLSLMKGDDVI